ncbi:MAG: DEAD/DEAH box helicase [Paracoccaceae bacterium]|nr:DEAD/DEAH box helicase [Paracoccaceae bacterium]
MSLNDCVLHGGWVPGGAGGSFVIWAEGFETSNGADPGQHPFHLDPDTLHDVIQTAFPDPRAGPSAKPAPFSLHALLPSDSKGPAPSLEWRAGHETETTEPDSWRWWTVEGLSIANPMAVLDSIDFLRDFPEIRIGSDLRFWAGLSARLDDAIRRHEYLPAVFPKARPLPKSGRKRRGKLTEQSVTFETGWELTEEATAALVESFSVAIPGICRSLRTDVSAPADDGPRLHEAKGLIRHFVSAELQRRIRTVRFPVSALKRFRDPFPGKALPDPVTRFGQKRSAHYADVAVTETEWRQWRRWRDSINRSAAAAEERICFRLTDPEAGAPDQWCLEWLLTSRSDPSLVIPLSEFWTTQRSARSLAEVLLQLGQAARLYTKLWEGMESRTPDSVFLDRSEALAFLREDAPILQGAGFQVIVPSWWTVTGQRRLRLRMSARSTRSGGKSGTESSGILGMDTVVEWQPTVVLDGIPMTREEWEAVVRAKEGLVFMRGQWMELSAGEVARLEEFWQAEPRLEEASLADMLRASADPETEVVFQDGLGQAMSQLREPGTLEVQDQPDSLTGTLRNYQLRGLSWLSFLEGLGFGACLADDMGLGKTVQVLATLLRDLSVNPGAGPTLLVAPTSVLGNWQREASRFAPTLKTGIHHGSQRPKTLEDLRKSVDGLDLVILSFGVARLDSKLLKRIRWRRLVVDEAQNLKNPAAAITKALAAIPSERRVALTGTPVENRLLDLWSLFSVVNPGFLGNVTQFRREFERPIMRDADRKALARLKEMVQPFILRRLKSDKSIIRDLPEKIEQNAHCSLTSEQATLYESVVRDIDARLTEEDGISRQGLMLSALTRLKQICNHPAQYLQDGSDFSESRSHKLARVCEMLDEIHSEGESVLLFSQFTEVCKALEARIRGRIGCPVHYLHGGTPIGLRQHMVDQFQDPDSEPSVFVLSLRAAGVGLTLTRANHVIHFDRWWNPAVENQATDRAYRIGQTKVVLVHKMVTLGTLEERIDRLIESKRKLAEEVVGAGESWLADMGNDAFRDLIRLDRQDAVIA